MDTNTIQFKRNIGDKGGVPAISIPPQLMEYLQLIMGDEVVMVAQQGKHGRYIALWKKENKEG